VNDAIKMATSMGSVRDAHVCADQLGLVLGEAQILWLLSRDGEASTGDLVRRVAEKG
jgi:hypothetical protein